MYRCPPLVVQYTIPLEPVGSRREVRLSTGLPPWALTSEEASSEVLVVSAVAAVPLLCRLGRSAGQGCPKTPPGLGKNGCQAKLGSWHETVQWQEVFGPSKAGTDKLLKNDKNVEWTHELLTTSDQKRNSEIPCQTIFWKRNQGSANGHQIFAA